MDKFIHKLINYIMIYSRTNFILSIFVVTFFFGLSACASTKSVSSSSLVGKHSIAEWLDKSNWDKSLYNNTEFSQIQISNFIKEVNKRDIKFTIFASSTCNECANSLPYFLKLIETAKIEDARVTLIGLDDYWEEPGNSHKKYKISEIPIIFLESGSITYTLTKDDFVSYDKIMEKINEN